MTLAYNCSGNYYTNNYSLDDFVRTGILWRDPKMRTSDIGVLSGENKVIRARCNCIQVRSRTLGTCSQSLSEGKFIH